MSRLEIVRTGIIALIEDRGRFGYGEIGITQSGMADRYSGTLANKLLGNPADTALLEISLGGAELISHTHTCIALTGADSILTINGKRKKLWHSHSIKPNDTIKIGMASRGQRIYLSVKGGFDIPIELGSRSTTTKEMLGYTPSVGDLLPCQGHFCSTHTFVPPELIPTFDRTITLRLLPAYQWGAFTEKDKKTFFSTPYKVTTSTDRMGCRLSGEPISPDTEIISEPISYGAVQIPSDGQPIVLLNERQTIGGYPKIGTIIPMDAYMLSQAQPGTKVYFEEIDIDEATRLTKKLYGFLAE